MIVFVACGKLKEDHPCMAKDMYIGRIFRKSMTYAKLMNPRVIYILSAKYGLLELTDMISPYNQTLTPQTKNKKKRWAIMVYRQMISKGIDFNEEAVFLCGRAYDMYLSNLFPHHSNPLHGLQMGEREAYLTKEIAKCTQ